MTDLSLWNPTATAEQGRTTERMDCNIDHARVRVGAASMRCGVLAGRDSLRFNLATTEEEYGRCLPFAAFYSMLPYRVF